MSAIAVLAAMLVYGVVHSITASAAFKDRVAGLMGERAFLGLYRLFHSVLSVLTYEAYRRSVPWLIPFVKSRR